MVWLAFDPFELTWNQVFGGAVALSMAGAIASLLLRRWDWARRRAGRIPPPGRLATGLVSRLGVPSSSLLDPRWARARSATVGFLMFATVAGFMGWKAGQEDQILQSLRDHGRRTEATVVSVADRSEEGRANSLTVRFTTPSNTVQADIDVGDGSGNDAKPGGHVPVVYNPSDPTEVRHADRLDGSDADGIRLGSVVAGLLAAGFLVGTAREVVRVKEQTEAETVVIGLSPGGRHGGRAGCRRLGCRRRAGSARCADQG
ncbi:DUF3592 domain-containing protein [Streptomyces populi]|uniref:DUF3592 domain-containing protein n=1 Tax=Streptomyces populi TaxID=2058924 RepID=UPI0013A6D3A9|nr:DUF3592 domain-containing protein [Streptomyces populi]